MGELESVPRILLVDDDVSIRLLLEKALSMDGFGVDPAPDTNAALKLLDLKRHVLVISDLSMPGRSGMELIKDVRARSSRLPILVVSSDLDLDTRGELQAIGRLEYLAKPFTLTAVRATVERLTAKLD